MYLRLIAYNQWNEAFNSNMIGHQIEKEEKEQQDEERIFYEPQSFGSDASQSCQILKFKNDFSHFCPRCGKAYTRTHSLNRHIRFECGVEPQFECHICHKKSKHKHNLMIHMKTHDKS